MFPVTSQVEVETVESKANTAGMERVEGSITYRTPTLREISEVCGICEFIHYSYPFTGS